MPKLKKEDFNKKYRFRESRREDRKNLVSCVSCLNKFGGNDDKEGPAFCEHSKRDRKIKIAEYWRGWFTKSHNISSERVCDAYTSKPLPEGVNLPVISEKQAILLHSQNRHIYHADQNCPYIVEETRMLAAEKPKRWEMYTADLSEKVPGETIRAICEMPCCENKLPFQISMTDYYRKKVGIKPDGTEPIKWVRNGIVAHEKKIKMTLEEAEVFFDLTKFNFPEFKVHDKIITISSYLNKNSNFLGSRPLSEAVNPVHLSCNDYHILKDSLISRIRTNVSLWVYDQRLFNIEKGLEKPVSELEKIPEGIIPCMDPDGIFDEASFMCKNILYGTYNIYGIVKPLTDNNLLSKGLEHFIQIGAISYHGGNHMWGVFGKGFDSLASFDSE